MKHEKLIAEGNSPKDYDNYFNVLKKLPTGRAEYRTKKALELLNKTSGSVLSIGVGNLTEAIILEEAGFSVTVCDISMEAVNYAKENGFKSFQCDITKKIESAKYDFVFALEVLEHLVNPKQSLNNLIEVLEDSGQIAISLPNEFNLLARIMVLFGKPPFGGHKYHHLRFFNKKFSEQMFQELNLDIINRTYSPLVPLWNKVSIRCGEFLQKLSPNLFTISFIWIMESKSEKDI